MTIKEFFSFSRNRYFWLHILGMILFVVIAIFASLKGIDIYTQHGESVSVPDVKRMQLHEAEAQLHSQSLEFTIIDSSYIDNLPAGAIIEQNPAPGARVKRGRLIYLTINSGNIPTRTIPDIIDNCSLREAQAKIGAAGFALGENEYIQGEKDWVYGVKYKGNELASKAQIPIGATLVLVVGDDKFDEKAALDSLNQVNGNLPHAEEAAEVDESWF